MKKLLYFGPEGSYTQKAMNKSIELLDLKEYSIKECLNIGDIINSIEENDDYIGVIPIENSIEGVVRETVDKLIRTKSISIFQEIIIPVAHCLCNSSGDITKTRKIISHPQALAQCAGYIKNLSEKLNYNIEVLPVASTSQAAKSIKDLDESYSAIASPETAEFYGAKILDTSINDEKDNKTRFVCIGKINPDKTSNDTTAFAFTTLNKPGALIDVLSIFKEHNLNMSHIESRPSKKVLGEYMFYVNIDGHIQDENVKKAFEKIKPFTTYYKFLGSYPKYSEVQNG